MKAYFDHVDKEAANIATLWFRPEKPLDYIAGQYTELTVKHDNPDDRGDRRWFTLSSRPGQELVSITTKFSEPGSSFKTALQALQKGDEVDMAEAMGDFVLPKDTSLPLVFVAGGIGLTPFHSMFEWLAERGEERDIQFIYGVRSEDEIIFQPTFERAGIHATIVVSEPSEFWGGQRGRIDGELITGLATPTDKTLIYLSGPEPMIESLAADLEKTEGIAKQQIITDTFPGYTGV